MRFALVVLYFILFGGLFTASAQGMAGQEVTGHSANQPLELLSIIAWPGTVVLVSYMFRESLSSFLASVGSRITKLSIFKVELELVQAKSAASMPLLDEIKSIASSAELNDSSKMMLMQVQIGTPADYAVVGLGDGHEWITSRLYVASIMMERMRGLKAFVFVEKSANSERRFVAVASVSQLRWALARRSPWLEAAWTRSNMSLFNNYPAYYDAATTVAPLSPEPLPDPGRLFFNGPIVTSDTGSLDGTLVQRTIQAFIGSLQITIPPQAPSGTGAPVAGSAEQLVETTMAQLLPAARPDEWVSLRSGTVERSEYVTRELLSKILSPAAFDAWADEQRDATRARKTRALLRRSGDFVAMLSSDREFVNLINRRALLEDVGRSAGEEPE